MATNSGGGVDAPLKPQPQPHKPTPTPEPTTTTTTKTLDSSPNPTPIPNSKPPNTPAAVNFGPRESNSSPESDIIHVPSYSRWFSWNNIHECEVRILPEFFDGKSPSKTPKVYKYYRNTIVKIFRDSIKQNRPSKENPTPKITFTEARKTIVGDVGSVRKVFDFLEAWGLINYFGSPITKAQLKWEDKESKNVSATPQQNNDPNGANSTGEVIVSKKKFCSSCHTLCTIACFSNLKKDTTFCARCYVRAGVNTADFKRVEISEDVKTDWTEKETLHLLEAVMHYGDDWKKVSEHVVGRSEKECVDRFIKLPFGEQYTGPPDSVDPEEKATDQIDTESSPSKKMRPTPFDDASNPIVAQAAFLSTLVGVEVAERAASAAVKALTEVSNETSNEFLESTLGDTRDHDSVTTNGKSNTNSLKEAYLEAKTQLEKEERELETTISDIVEVKAKDIHDKIVRFEELELQMEREWQQLRQMQSSLFADQLTLLFNKSGGTSRKEHTEQKLKTESSRLQMSETL
ncbi:SWI/SNF complex subunit SWI3B [Rutidosis leptorrhynchoides]|uniref:SWI/SNF complex subunit SWI3B n=1 Tax=Rutidosis leptorrhynchoides TaxID=125765 RepID=UPI003A990E61